MKKQIRLIALDLDGTLLDDQKQLSENNIQALAECAVGAYRLYQLLDARQMGFQRSFVRSLEFVMPLRPMAVQWWIWKPEGG